MRSCLAIAVVCCLAGWSCLARDATEPGHNGGTANLVVRADVATAAVVLVVVEVTAPDIASPLIYNIPVVGGVASATITLPAGSNRTITMHAFDAGAVETHRGSVTVNIQPGENPTIPLVLTPLTGDAPINATLGSFVVTVAPVGATVDIGGSATLTATIVDANGAPVAQPVTWATANPGVASVTSGGVVTGVWVGQTTIVATFHGAAASATVTVTGLTWPNEPAGFRVMTDFGFETQEGNGWLWNRPVFTPNIVTDFTAPRSPSTVLQFFYPVGFPGGFAPGTEFFRLPHSREIYAGFWWKASNPWQGHSSGVNKISFAVSDDFSTDVILTLHQEEGAGYRLLLFPGGVTNVHVEQGTGGYLEGNVDPNVPVTLGQWHRIELHLKYSTTPTSEDGIVRWWLDGTLIGDYTSANFEGNTLQEWQFSPTWGGTGDSKTEEDYFWLDHVHLSVP